MLVNQCMNWSRLSCERGAQIASYSLLLIFLAVFLIVVLQALSGEVVETLEHTEQEFSNVNG